MLKLIMIPCSLYLICMCVGYVVCKLSSQKYTVEKGVIYGYISCIAIFHIIAIPFMYFEGSFLKLYYISLVVCGSTVCCALGFALKNRKNIINTVRIKTQNMYYRKKELTLLAICILMIFFQTVYVVYYQHTDIDDSYYLAQMNTILHTNRVLAVDPASGIEWLKASGVYKLVSYEVLCSVIIKLFRVNTAFFAHTIIPVFLIPLHYLVIYRIGKLIDEKRSYFFLLIYGVCNLYSGYSGYSQGAFLLYRIWQGKAVMINIIMLILICEFLECYKVDKLGKFKILFMSFVLLAGFHSTTVGLYLMPIAYFCLVAGYLFITFNWKNVIRLCIPILIVLPNVLLKAKILMFSSMGNGASVVENIAAEEKISYSVELVDKVLNGYSGLLLVYTFALICIFIIGTREERGAFAVPAVILVVTFLNPLLVEQISDYITGTPVYWRLFWLLEIPLTISIAINMLAGKCKAENTMIVACVGILLVSINGEYILNSLGFEHRSNKYKLDERAVEIADVINSDADNQEVSLLLPVEWSYGIREYCGNIELLLNRYTDGAFEESGKASELKELYDGLINPLYINQKWNAKEIEEKLNDFSINYVVVSKEALNQNNMGEDMKVLFDNSEYVIYKYMTK